MCPPTYLPELSDEYTWSSSPSPLDRGRALQQWEQFASLVVAHIGPVQLLQAEPWAPAMTFTRDLAVGVDGNLIALCPTSRRGAFETPLFAKLDVAPAHAPISLDGGNVLADRHGRLLIGAVPDPPGELAESAATLGALTERTPFRVPIAGGRFPHIDMAVTDLGGHGWLVYPDALPGFDLSDGAWQVLFLDLPVVQASPVDGENLACNLICTEKVAVGPEITTDLRGRIEKLGLEYIATPLDELLKAGGGAHCLTQELPG